MRVFTFWHGRLTGEPLAWADYRPGGLWVVVNGRALALTWGEGCGSPWGRAAQKPKAG
jgi:hypothetical protein